MSLPSFYPNGILPPSTIVPKNENLFIPYLTRLYEQIAQTVNAKDGNYFMIPITSTATNIPNLPNFGAFIVCVSGALTTLPTLTASLCKSDASASGSIAVLGSQAGTGAWATFNLTITSTATNFQIAHNNTGVTGNFNIRILGTQGAI
jgi:hypothetical protein